MKIAIVIPVYNRQALVKDALDSVLAQSYSDWECIVVDDGSTDNTWQVLQEYAAKDERIKVFQRNREPKGAPTCRNIGWQKATTRHIMFLDSDDIMLSFCLEQRVQFIAENSTLDFALFPVFQTKKNEYVYRSLINEKELLNSFLSFQSTFQTSSTLWTKTTLRKINGWDEEALSWQDGEVHIRVLLQSQNYKWGSEVPDVYLRKHGGNSITQDKNPNKKINFYNTLKKIYTLLPPTEQAFFYQKILRLVMDQLEFNANNNMLTEDLPWISLILKDKDIKKVKRYNRWFHFTHNIPLLGSLFYRLRSWGLIQPKRRNSRIFLKVPMEIIDFLKEDKNFISFS